MTLAVALLAACWRIWCRACGGGVLIAVAVARTPGLPPGASAPRAYAEHAWLLALTAAIPAVLVGSIAPELIALARHVRARRDRP